MIRYAALVEPGLQEKPLSIALRESTATARARRRRNNGQGAMVGSEQWDAGAIGRQVIAPGDTTGNRGRSGLADAWRVDEP